jgi:hypothetical protein
VIIFYHNHVDERQHRLHTHGTTLMKEHPDKHIRAAIHYAVEQGWIFVAGGKSAHCFGRLKCGIPKHQEHMMSIWSTPAVPVHHAHQIIRMVERCKPGVILIRNTTKEQ